MRRKGVLAFGSILSVLSSMAAMSAWASSCSPFSQMNFRLNLRTAKAEVVAPPEKPTQLCEPLPSGGGENVRVTVHQGAKLRFKRDIFVTLTNYFDVLRGKKSHALEGGARAAETAYFATYLPTRWISGAQTSVEFHAIGPDGSPGKLLGQGTLVPETGK